MRGRGISLPFVALLLVAEIAVASPPMPRGSFLRQPAHSAAQLAAQIRRDSVVATRYEKHYRVPASQFASYVQTQLGLRRLSKGGRYRVFHVRPDGSIGSQVLSLRKGTAVFLHLRTGKPILLAECGNPMGTNLPGLLPATAEGQPNIQTPSTLETPASEADETLLSPAAVTAPEAWEASLLPNELLLDLPVEGAEARLSIPDPILPQGASANYSAFASLMPLLIARTSGLSFSGTGGPSLPPQRGALSPPAVPEPSTLMLWAVAGGGALLTRLPRRTREKQTGS